MLSVKKGYRTNACRVVAFQTKVFTNMLLKLKCRDFPPLSQTLFSWPMEAHKNCRRWSSSSKPRSALSILRASFPVARCTRRGRARGSSQYRSKKEKSIGFSCKSSRCGICRDGMVHYNNETQSHCNPVLLPYQHLPSLEGVSAFCTT